MNDLNNVEDIQVQSLSEKVQDFRDKARDILRMKAINNLLQEKFHMETSTKGLIEDLKNTTKDLARVNYRITKLDEEDPDYEDKMKNAKSDKEHLTEQIERIEKRIEERKIEIDKRITETNEQITKWESGENKVSIESVEELADRMIQKI